MDYNEKEMGILLKIPINTITMSMTVRFINSDGEVKQQTAEFDHSDIIDFRRDFLDNVEFGDDYDAIYKKKKKGIQYQKLLEHKCGEI